MIWVVSYRGQVEDEILKTMRPKYFTDFVEAETEEGARELAERLKPFEGAEVTAIVPKQLPL